LFNLLAGFGSQAGRHAYTVAGCSRHYPNLFGVLAGASGKGRKGTSWHCINRLLTQNDEAWTRDCLATGLHSGEGLIHHVRDPRLESRAIKENGRIMGYQDEQVDAGVSDKRLFVVEEELGSVLRRMKGRENSLSAILREAWDGNDLRSLVKNSPDRATAPHISIVGHITKAEAIDQMTAVDCQNGFANRFLWVFTERSRCLPEAGEIPLGVFHREIAALQSALSRARETERELPLEPEASAFWREVYPALSDGQPGLYGSVIGRAEAQVRRLALVYALLDGRDTQSREHLESALAFWRYCDATAAWLFGTAFNHSDADRIFQALQKHPVGLTLTQINSEVFANHARSQRIDEALRILEKSGVVQKLSLKTGGADRTVWKLNQPAK